MNKRILTAIVLLGLVGAIASAQVLSYTYFNNGQYNAAVVQGLYEIQQDPSSVESHAALCWGLLAVERFQEALQYGTRGKALAPNDRRFDEILGRSHFYLGNYLSSLEYYRQYIRNTPSGPMLPYAYYFIGEIYIIYSEFNLADMALTTACELIGRSDRPYWWGRLGFAREQAADLNGALAAYTTALAAAPNQANALEGRARVTAAQAAQQSSP